MFTQETRLRKQHTVCKNTTNRSNNSLQRCNISLVRLIDAISIATRCNFDSRWERMKGTLPSQLYLQTSNINVLNAVIIMYDRVSLHWPVTTMSLFTNYAAI